MTPMEMSYEQTFSCAICSRPAGTVLLEGSDTEPRLIVSNFVGRLEFYLQPVMPRRLQKALKGRDVRSLFEQNLEFAPFYCPVCHNCYCEKHWVFWDVHDGDGWFDSTRGVCPSGHERMLSD